MSDVAENLRQAIISDERVCAIVGNRVHQAHVPESSKEPYIWYGRETSDSLRTLDGIGGPFSHYFNVEAVSPSLDQSQKLAEYIRERLDNQRVIGTVSFKGVFVEEHTDEYIPRGIYSDEGLKVSALHVQVFP